MAAQVLISSAEAEAPVIMGLLVNRLDATGSILAVMVAALVIALWHTSAVVSGDYPHDVELFEPATVTTTMATIIAPKRNRGVDAFHQHVSHYPSYVKGEDPVEEYNRRRLHVDTSDYVKGAQTAALTDTEQKKLLEESLIAFRKKYAKRRGDQGDKKKDKLKTVKKFKKRRKVKDTIKRSWLDDPVPVINGNDSVAFASMDVPKRYEESDPDVFPYEQSSNSNQRQSSLPMETKYFQ